jgi:hypothetical protein
LATPSPSYFLIFPLFLCGGEINSKWGAEVGMRWGRGVWGFIWSFTICSHCVLIKLLGSPKLGTKQGLEGRARPKEGLSLPPGRRTKIYDYFLKLTSILSLKTHFMVITNVAWFLVFRTFVESGLEFWL